MWELEDVEESVEEGDGGVIDRDLRSVEETDCGNWKMGGKGRVEEEGLER